MDKWVVRWRMADRVVIEHKQVRVNALVCLTKTRSCYGRQVLIDAILPTLRVCGCCGLGLHVGWGWGVG